MGHDHKAADSGAGAIRCCNWQAAVLGCNWMGGRWCGGIGILVWCSYNLR